MYESFAGNGMLCNPEAIFRALVTEPEFAHLTHVWVLTSKRENPAVVREFARSRSVRFVRPGSSSYYRALATSGFLINNATFPPEFSKRPSQKYLNTWHGTPLKRMGYDIGDPATRVANVVRNLLSADFLLSANPFMTEHLYEKAHLLRPIYRGAIIEEGYPRIDRQFLDDAAAAAARATLEAGGVSLGGRQIILYAPTWKGTSFSRPEDDIRELVSRVRQLEALIDASKYVVLLKTHQVVHRFASDIPGLARRLVPNEIPSNVILGITGLLVTDYSSIFFDFLATGRPIFFLAPDLADYAGYRGLYLDPAEWPGPVVDTVEKLAGAVNDYDRVGVDGQAAANHRAMRSRFVPREDGHATQRVIDIVFRGKRAGYAIASLRQDERRTVLISAGSLRPNGVTSALVALLDAIDYRRFDVSVIFPSTRVRSVVDQQRRLDSRVRQFARVGGMNGSKLSLARMRAGRGRPRRAGRAAERETQLWRDEWRRLFGATTFDFALDFGGTSSFWAMLLLQAPDARRSIWLHDDIAQVWADQRLLGARRARELRRICALYADYDRLVSPSPELAATNAASLHAFADPQSFTSARSLIGGDRILADAAIDLEQLRAGDAPTPDWATDAESAGRSKIFASLGRLSEENDPQRLLRAFAAVHAIDQGSRLIVIGEGPLASVLAAEVSALGLTAAVWLAGYRTNPYRLLRRSDCLVFTGHRAREPRVILQARVLGMPIVTVPCGYGSDGPPEGVLEVPADDAAVTDGMVAFLAGKVGTSSVDWRRHDRDALASFYRAIGAVRGA